MARKPDQTDLTDKQWNILECLIPPPKEGGRPRSVNMREIIKRHILVDTLAHQLT